MLASRRPPRRPARWGRKSREMILAKRRLSHSSSLRMLAVVVAGAGALCSGGSPAGHRNHLPWTMLRLRGGDLDAAVPKALQAMGLAHHCAPFAREGIQARNLPDLTADDLAEMGLSQQEVAVFLAHFSVHKPQDGASMDATVRETLISLGLEQHCEAFQREGIRARNLADLSSDDLAELGLSAEAAAILQRHCKTAQRPPLPSAARAGAETDNTQVSSLSKRKRAKVGMASTGSVSSHHTSKENTGVSKTEEHVERLLTLLCGASAQAAREAASTQLAALFWAHEAWQRPLMVQLLARLRDKRWATREAAALGIARILAAAGSGEATAARRPGCASCAEGGRPRGIEQDACRSAVAVFDFEGEIESRAGVMLWATRDEAATKDEAHGGHPKRQRLAAVSAPAGREPGCVPPCSQNAGVETKLTIGYTGRGAGAGRQEELVGGRDYDDDDDVLDRSGWWPFDGLCKALFPDLIHEDWERRHGAARGLRLLLSHHPLHRGTCAARPSVRVPDTATATTDECGQRPACEDGEGKSGRIRYGETRAFVESCAAQLLRVLAFDRFSDYSGDMVVSPVREAAAQALAVALQRLHETQRDGARDTEALSKALRTMKRMSEWEEDWEVRQSSLLALKYMVAILPESCHESFVDTAREVVLKGFKDVDDVRAVAADTALLMCRRGFGWLDTRPLVRGPAARQASPGSRSHDHGPNDSHELTEMVWECLEDCDEVSCSTAPILSLLAQRLKRQDPPTAPAEPGGEGPSARPRAQAERLACQEGGGDVDLEAIFGDGLSRLRCLLKFFRHNLASVRKATVGVLAQVVASNPSVLSFPVRSGSQDCGSESHVFAEEALEVVFLNALIEVREDLVDETQGLWRVILDYCPTHVLGALAHTGSGHTRGISRHMRMWLQAAATPAGCLLSPKDVCSSEEYLECLSMFASYAARPAASSVEVRPAKKQRKGQGRRHKGEEAAAEACASVGAAGNKYDVGSATRQVVCRMLAMLLIRASGQRAPETELPTIEDSSAHGWVSIMLSASFSFSDPWLKFIGTWVALEMISQPFDTTTASDESAGDGCGGVSRGAGVVDGPRLSRSVEDLLTGVVTSNCERTGGLDRDTSALAAGCLLLAVSRRAVKPGSSREQERAQEQQRIEGLVLAVLRCLGQQADAVLQRRNACVLAEAAQRSLLSRKAASQIFAEVCCDASITPLSASCLQMPPAATCDQPSKPSASSKIEEACVSDQVSVDMLLRHVPNHGEGSTSVLQGDEYLAGLVGMRERECRIRQRGAQMVLENASRMLQEDLLLYLPGLWEISGGVLDEACAGIFQRVGGRGIDEEATQQQPTEEDVIRALQLVEVVLPCCARGVGGRLSASALEVLPGALRHSNAALRHMAARCLARVAAFDSLQAVQVLVRQVLPMFEDAADVNARLGAAETVYRAVETLRHDLLPYAVFLVTPALSRMSDAHTAVREAATRCFASLLRVLPLEQGIPDPEGLPHDLAVGRVRERRFLEQLWNPAQLEPFAVSANISASLRPYQLEGVNWLGFLVKYRLHGILCDDMGLGKTLQTIAVMASVVVNSRQRYAAAGLDVDCPLPSLVVCPSTLVQHWCHEVGRFCTQLKAVAYCGVPHARQELLAALRRTDDVLVVSYEALRNDVDKFVAEGFAWNFAVLDEGHIVKNPKSKTSAAVKEVGLCAKHRLILTGTPIQNNVLELWGLFDFLMPSFLGSEARFNQVYSKPILASGRDLRVDQQRFKRKQGASAAVDAAGGALAAQQELAERSGVDDGEAKVMEAADAALDKLHRQVLPFMLRRTKQQVLDDLPPKIIQDVVCPMTPLQQALVSIGGSEQEALQRQLEAGQASEATPKALSALLYLKRVANHPMLVLCGEGSGKGRVNSTQARELLAQYHPGATAKDLAVAPKMLTLKQLLCDCGIGSTGRSPEAEQQGWEDGEEPEGKSKCGRWQGALDVASGVHRVLVFSQMRAMLDIIERDLLAEHFPGVSYLRMDGTTPVQRRFGMQLEFNSNPSVKVMLLTTHVGGLGLTLTGADTVIFVDHDWNPMRDLQAMDRAHRIGQTRTVNVYRLIAQGSLEERIMGLQSFKLNIANTVVSHDNAKLASMGTSHALGLHNAQGSEQAEPPESRRSSRNAQQSAGRGRQALEVAAGVGAGGGEQDELWDEDEYADLDAGTFASQQGLTLSKA